MHSFLLLFQMLKFNPIALRKAKIVYNFGLSECNRVKRFILIFPCGTFNFYKNGFPNGEGEVGRVRVYGSAFVSFDIMIR